MRAMQSSLNSWLSKSSGSDNQIGPLQASPAQAQVALPPGQGMREKVREQKAMMLLILPSTSTPTSAGPNHLRSDDASVFHPLQHPLSITLIRLNHVPSAD